MTTSLLDGDDDDMELLMRDYCMPSMAEMTTESLLTKSQYAKVIFHDLLASYPTDADVLCRYSVTDGITVREGDKVALFRVGWSAINEHLLAVAAPMPVRPEDNEFEVLLKANKLTKDTREFYQLCYVSVEGSVCGASVPFQFHQPYSGELREVEEQGWGVVRSHTAIQTDRLLRATEVIQGLETKTANLEKERDETNERLLKSDTSLAAAQRDLLQLISEKGVLSRKNEQLEADLDSTTRSISAVMATSNEMSLEMEKQSEKIAYLTLRNTEMKRKEDELLCANEELKRSNEEYLLKNAEMTAMMDELAREKAQLDRDAQRQREWTVIQNKKMEGCIQTLNNEKAELTAQLEDLTRLREADIVRLRTQLDGLQQMLDVSTQSKEMATQALHAEHSKVIQLEEDKCVLETELTEQTRRHKDEVSALANQLRDTQRVVETLTKQLAQQQQDLTACRIEAAENAAAAAQLRRESGFDPLLDEYEDMRRRADMLAEENVALGNLRRENVELQKQAHKAAQESAGVAALEAENGALRAENGTLARQLQQLRTSAALRKRREAEVEQLEAGRAEREAADAAMKAEQEAKVEALLLEHSMMVNRLQEMQAFQDSGAADSSRSVSSLILANEELMRANEGLTKTNDKLAQALKATEAAATNGSNGYQLHESPGCLDLSFTIKVMDLQNRKGDAELALADAQAAEEAAWAEVVRVQAALTELNKVATEAENELNDADRESAAADQESVKLAAAMKHLQEAMLNEDSVNGLPDTDHNQQRRLEVLLQRWDTLAERQAQLTSTRYDLRQDAAVREDERRELTAAAAGADARHKEATRAKHELLETLVMLDNKMLAITAGTAVQEEALVGERMSLTKEEERLVHVHYLEGDGTQGTETFPDLASLNLTSADWEFVAARKPEKKELDVSSQASKVSHVSQDKPNLQIVPENDLSLRLDLAAAEYRKLFIEKARLEKRLAVLEKQLANPTART